MEESCHYPSHFCVYDWFEDFCTAIRKTGGTVLPSVRQSKLGASGTAGNSEEGLFLVPVGLSILTQEQNIIENC